MDYFILKHFRRQRVAAVVVHLGLEALFLMFVLFTSQTVSSHSFETTWELLSDSSAPQLTSFY